MAKKKVAGAKTGEGGGASSSPAPDLEAVQKDWMEIVERHERKRSTWITRADKIVKLYAESDGDKVETAKRKYAVLWANVQVLCPATYSRAPKCVVSRRFQTPSQDVRNAVLGLERATNITIENAKLHDAIMSARLDRFLPGRGTIWIRYESKDDGQSITEQKVFAEHVDVKDFGHGEGRTWAEIDCVWRRTYMSEEKLKTRFGDDVLTRANVTLDYSEKDAPEDERQATVYEIWCKSKKTVYWLAKTAKQALEVGPPPLDLKNFFPFPKPVFATLTNKHCLPTPDYIYYQDQAEEITRLTKRIDRLTDSLKLVGFYPAGPATEGRSEIERALTPGFENKLIPVPSWASFAEKGGVGQIQWLPVDMVVKIIESCVQLRKQLLDDVFQITGISDIMRGETNASETLGAQQLKSQYGSNRLKDTKDDFVRFAKEACEIVAEIVAEHFTPETLGKLSQIPHLQVDPQTKQLIVDPATNQPAIATWITLLRNQMAREVLIDVETDSTVQPDEDAEKARRTEFMTAFGVAMQPLMQLQTMQPQVAQAVLPLFGDLMTFVARGFRAGRELEERIEETLQALGKLAGQQVQQAQGQPQQSPEAAKAAAETTSIKAREDAHVAELKRNDEADRLKTDRAAALADKQFVLRQRELDLDHSRSMQAMHTKARIDRRSAQMKGEEQGSAEQGVVDEGDDSAPMPQGEYVDPDTQALRELAQAVTASAQASMQAAQSANETAQAVMQLAEAVKAPRRLVKMADGSKIAVTVN